MIKLKNGKFYIRDPDTLEEIEWFDTSEAELTYTQEEKEYEFPIGVCGDCSASFTATITGGTLYDWMCIITEAHKRHQAEIEERKQNLLKPKTIKGIQHYEHVEIRFCDLGL